MEHLYQKHFGLNQPPFNITPDPSFLYLSASHQEGLAQLMYGISARRGFILLTGEVGTGSVGRGWQRRHGFGGRIRGGIRVGSGRDGFGRRPRGGQGPGSRAEGA